MTSEQLLDALEQAKANVAVAEGLKQANHSEGEDALEVIEKIRKELSQAETDHKDSK